MSTTFRPAPAVERIAADLIAKHHPTLDDVRIEYVFLSDTPRSKGKDVWGRARKISGLNAYLAQEDQPTEAASGDVDFFVIEIAEPVWVILDSGQRVALVDHELCHCTTVHDEDTGDLTLKIVAHDLEEFRAVVDRHGLWQPALAHFAEVVPFQQRRIDDALSDADVEATVSINGGPPIPLAEAGPALGKYLEDQMGGDAA